MSETTAAVMADTCEITAIAAPTGDEGARADWVAARLPGARTDAAGDVIVAPHAAGAAPPVVLAAHLDTVFGHDAPLDVRRDGDRLCGPGVGDNSLAVAVLVSVADALGRLPPTRRPIVCAFTVGEEGRGDLRGARAVVADLAPAALLAVEGHFGDRLGTTAVGSTRLEVTMRGPGGYSWGERGGPSAIHALARAAALIADIPRSPDGAVSVGVIEGGTSVNTLAARARMEVDLRATRPDELHELERRARAAVGAAAAREGAAAEVADIGRRPAGGLEPGDALRAELLAVRAALGMPAPDESPVSTDANAALGAGVRGATLGVSHGGGMHTPGEWIATGPIALGLLLVLASALAVADRPLG
jgi:tripeptide aminopeptidase